MGRRCYVLTGPPGSGKTPVLDELVGLGYRTVPEMSREIIAEQRLIDPRPVYDRDPALFVWRMLERAVADHESEGSSEGPVFFDRGIPDVVGFFELMGALDPSPAWEAARRHRYNDLVFVLPPWPEIYTTDLDRRMTFDQSAAFGRRVLEIYEELGYTVVDVPRAIPAERAAFIVDHIAP